MVDKHREFLGAMTEMARRALDQLPDDGLGDLEIGLSLLEFSGELATAIQPGVFGDELPPDLVAACEKTVTTAMHVTAELMTGMVDSMREITAILRSGHA